MRSSMLTRVLGMILLAVVLGGLIGWWASRAVPPKQKTSEVAPPKVVIAEPEPKSQIIPPAPKSNAIAVAPTPASAVASDDSDTWEEKLDTILLSETDSNQKGEDLLKLMPTVNEEAQTELAGHIVNLLDDAHFAEAGNYLTNADVPEAVSSVFLNDLYNRENSLKLPLVLAVASNEKHPLRDEAKDLLELYLEEDHGTNWAAWETAMNTWLKEHPEEQ